MSDLMDLFDRHFWRHFPRRKQTPAIRGNKVMLAKKLGAAVDREDTTWLGIEEKTILYAKSDTVAAGFIVLPATWCSETNDNGPGWSWEYEIPQTPEEILAAKPLNERTREDWLKILSLEDEDTFMWGWLANNWNSTNGPAPGNHGCLVPLDIQKRLAPRKFG